MVNIKQNIIICGVLILIVCIFVFVLTVDLIYNNNNLSINNSEIIIDSQIIEVSASKQIIVRLKDDRLVSINFKYNPEITFVQDIIDDLFIIKFFIKDCAIKYTYAEKKNIKKCIDQYADNIEIY